MANTLTGLVPTIYDALDKVSRELVGFIPAVQKAASADRAAIGQAVNYPVVPTLAAGDIAPAAYGPSPSDVTLGYGTLTLTKQRFCSFQYSGEDIKGLDTNGPGIAPILSSHLQQAFRTLGNEIEVAIAALMNFASRAYCVSSGHTFDSTDLITSIAQARRILSDNGAPIANGDLHLVLDTGFGATLRGLTQLFKANEAGSDVTLRDGALLSLFGMNIGESGGFSLLTQYSGTPSALVIDGTGNTAKGSTSLKLKTGTGSFKKGDVITIGSDITQRYVVVADGTATTVVINNPGVVAAIADGNAVAKVYSTTTYMPLAAFARNAIVLGTRRPAMPIDGDSGEHVAVQDPLTGIVYDVAKYAQYHRESWEVGLCWGVTVAKNEHLALIMGT
jgi:hypothetical protein